VEGQKAGSCHEGSGQWLKHYQYEHCTDLSVMTAPLVGEQRTKVAMVA